jgi:hypothetical protein
MTLAIITRRPDGLYRIRFVRREASGQLAECVRYERATAEDAARLVRGVFGR